MLLVCLFLGLAFGSFVNALVWRIFQQDLPKKKRAASDKDLSISTGRSMCPSCKHTLAWYDLLPVLSWVTLRGKCRYCQVAIGWQYPLVELATAGVFVGSYVYWPYSLTGILEQTLFALWLIAVVLFMALLVYDIRWMLLPNRLIFPLITVAWAYAVVHIILADQPLKAVLESLCAVAVAGGIFYVLLQISDGKWIGGGDVKLGLALGLLLSTPQQSFLMLFLASVLGLLASLPALALHKYNLTSRIPFGPFLITATILTVLFGVSIVDWYSATFLYI